MRISSEDTQCQVIWRGEEKHDSIGRSLWMDDALEPDCRDLDMHDYVIHRYLGGIMSDAKTTT